MKKILIPFIISAIILTSCTVSSDKGSFFDYQNGECLITGKWTESGNEYGAVLTLGEVTDGARGRMTVEFTSPESVKGTKYVFENGTLTATLGDMSIPMNAGSREKVFRLERMFSLSSEDIREIKTDENKDTVAIGASWTVTTNRDGTPKKIELDGTTFEIQSFDKKDTP